ncbi:LysR family transcriptional regulator [Microbacterium hominis]|uniref:LysR family transcriptional regulator n=1 Tax=Microbacterium hominis TaxID=162426 RepID=A0A7D4TJA1_9MICO|nr:LysR family transcriptional regulator [Microbacterium hominis]QKJ21261.1 LysR family transcriptional regulator [Microbacterium hominis]
MSDLAPLSRLDLNLLVSLDALLTERSVTRAAERLHLSQPALSAALARLRTHFNDPILARRGNTYELTPFAARLIEHTATALEAARRVFDSQATWTPTASTREFSVYGSDYAFATIGAAISKLAAERGLGITFRFMLHSPTIVEDAPVRLRSADAMIMPHGFLSDLAYVDLWNDDWVAIIANDHPDVEDTLTMEHLATLPFVMTYHARSAFTSAGRQIQQLGVEMRVEAVVESFIAMPLFVAGTRRVGVVQRALAPIAARMGGVRIVPLPFSATPLVNALWWHPVHARDPEHAWMIELFTEAGRIVEREAHALTPA